MPNANTLTQEGGGAKAEGKDPGPAQLNPFTRAAFETVEGAFSDVSTQLVAGSSTQVSDQSLPAFGWARSVLLFVEATGGAGGSAVADEDAPWNVLTELTVTDVNGRPLVGPINGYDLYLINKWGAYSFELDMANGPSYSAIDSNGDFTFIIRVPLEIGSRDGLGALPNQNSSQAYRFSYTVNTGGNVYGTPPATTLPSVRVRAYLEAWSPADGADPRGVPNMQSPPAPGTTQHWTKQTPDIGSGDRRVRISRVGNMVRTLIFVLRNSGARTTTAFPDLLRLELDNNNLMVTDKDILRHYMRERSGNAPDTGVIALTYTHDLDYRIGNEMRDLWLATTQATRLELLGSFGTSDSLEILVNDVAPAGNVHIG